MIDDDDRNETLKRDISRLVPDGYGSPRHAYAVILSGQATGSMIRLKLGTNIIGRGSSCDIVLDDAGVSRRHARLSLRPNGLVILEDLSSTNGTFVGSDRIEKVELNDGDRFQLGDATLLKFSFTDEFEESFQRSLHAAATIDGLTGVANRESFAKRLVSETSFAQRHGTPLALLMVDIDHFKRVNDTHGHQAGDHVLRTLGSWLRQVVRTEDVVARYGGEEFAVIARGIDPAQTKAFAERLRITIEALSIRWEEQELHITISIGAAAHTRESSEALSEIVQIADRALYQAKNTGRNKVVVFS